MAHLLGWKDVLKPIRDGYRHLFPPPDSGPTPEERERQRQLDRLKGFTYFDTIAQLESWNEAESDPLQRANTPLLPRPRGIRKEKEPKADVLLCHDYSGCYHGYEAVQPTGLDEESYTCEYLQFVDTFIYFSHKLICIPPPSWTNLLHRNGVKALGTLLVEPQTQDAERLLHHNAGGGRSPAYPMAKKLAAMAHHYGFDGWLLNIEKPFSKKHWDCSVLEDFSRQLRDALGADRRLIWYDAITTANKVAYQNALNAKNMPFAKACGGILVNYCWKEEDARNSYQMAKQHDLSPDQVFFGIDVWAQNKSSFTHPRVTYPEFGGGGTNTGIAVNELANLGLSAGIFAPAWSFEHFPKHGHRVERSMWDGRSAPEKITCSCGESSTYHPDNRGYSITRSARQYPAGSDSFFYTDFSRGFGRHGEQEITRLYGGKTMHSQLSSQSVLPHMSRTSARDDRVESGVNIMSQRLEDVLDESRLVIEAYSVLPLGDTESEVYERWLALFNLDMPADGTLLLTISYKCCLQLSMGSVSFYLKFTSGTHFLRLEESEDDHFQTLSVCIGSELGDTRRLEELGVHVRAPQLGHRNAQILELGKIRIVPRTAGSVPSLVRLEDVRLERRGEGEMEHRRLSWMYCDQREAECRAPSLPYSETTGPFSWFSVEIDGLSLGRAYATECTVAESLMKELRGKEVEVSIAGIGFDGEKLAGSSVRVQID
ncbi:glycoside hydrolase family 85 protein [Lentithecium fluviatile CBS 122367]|uniref:Glycoside hydrolase family 85 protein n=1 Tax=Lentithecium fluviatile CBS 122367 TaxID=1168545 RepID=A0A6G1JDF1_9PLEO|nr:glycoside hydrolase family 85 protein [Lentithecium fluviatile CBS 122367]